MRKPVQLLAGTSIYIPDLKVGVRANERWQLIQFHHSLQVNI